MKVIISGITGVVGSNIANELNICGHEIYGLSRNKSKLYDGVSIDLTDKNSIDANIDKIPDGDIFIHCAALIDNTKSLVELVQSNVIGTLNALEVARKSRAKTFVNISTTAVYGQLFYLPVDEKHPCSPQTPYALSKHLTEQALNNIINTDIKKFYPTITSFRIPSPVGRDMPLRSIVPIMLNQSMTQQQLIVSGDAGRMQNFLDIRDLANAVIASSKAENLDPIYNIASSESYSNYDLACIINIVTGNQQQIIDNSINLEYPSGQLNPQRWHINTDLAMNKLGFRSKFKLSETLQWLVNSDIS